MTRANSSSRLVASTFLCRIGATVLASLSVFGGEAAAQSTPRFDECAVEGDRCAFDGMREVYFGAENRWYKQTKVDGVECTVAAFGDPAQGLAKRCLVADIALREVELTNTSAVSTEVYYIGPSGEQNHMRTVAATGDAATLWLYPEQRLAFAQNEAWVGDMFVTGTGAKQAAAIPFTAPSDRPYMPRGPQCASEGEHCAFDGQRDVYYGAGDRWTVRRSIDGVPCTAVMFHDPAPRDAKRCHLGPASEAAVTISNDSGADVSVILFGESSEEQTLLRTLSPDEAYFLVVATDSRLGFADDLGWIGLDLRTGLAGPATVNVPIIPRGETATWLPGVEVTVTNTRPTDVQTFLLGGADGPVRLRGFAPGATYVQRLHPEQQLAFAEGSSWVGDTFVTGTATRQTVSVPFQAPSDRPYAPRGEVCAKEGERCAFTGSRDVYFGVGDRWIVKRARDGVACTAVVFQDPDANSPKRCFLAPAQELAITLDNRADQALTVLSATDSSPESQVVGTVEPGARAFVVAQSEHTLSFVSTRDGLPVGASHTVSHGSPATITLPNIPVPGGESDLAPVAVTVSNNTPEAVGIYHYVEPPGQSIRLRTLAGNERYVQPMQPGQRLATQVSDAWGGDVFVAGLEAKQSIAVPFEAPRDRPYLPLAEPCAVEGSRCVFTGVRDVYFGAADTWRVQRKAGGANCSTAVFGDPAPGARKRCLVGAENKTSVFLRNGSDTALDIIERGTEEGDELNLGPLAPGETRFVVVEVDRILSAAQDGKYVGADLVASYAAPKDVHLPYIEKPTRKRIQELATLVRTRLLAQQAKAVSDTPACWKNTYGRGVGTVPSSCGANQTKHGVFCYDNCQAGYKGIGFVCWQDCPNGSADQGAFCRFTEYGRGAGYAAWAYGQCEKENGVGNCEWWGAVVYPKCGPGYEPAGCCICRPSRVVCKDPLGRDMAGQFDLSCTRKSYVLPPRLGECARGQTMDAGGLCYTSCPKTHTGIGPVCWEQCPTSHPVNCGAACARSSTDCGFLLSEQISSPLITAGGIALTVASLGTATPGVVAAKAAASAAKTGAKVAAKTVAKSVARAAAKAALRKQVRAAALAGVKQGAKSLAKETLVDTTINTILTTAVYSGQGIYAVHARKEYADAIRKELAAELSTTVDEAAVDAIVETAMKGAESTNKVADFPWESLDPVGIAEIVVAYNLPLCSDVK